MNPRSWRMARPPSHSAASPPSSASPKDRHLEAGTATAAAGCVAVLGLSLSTAGEPHLGLFLFIAPVALLIADAVVAVHATRRARLGGTAHPSDVVVGDRLTLSVAVAGPRLPVIVSVAGRLPMDGASTSAPAPREVVAEPPGSGTLEGLAGSRGVVRSFAVMVRSNGLCGLIACVRAHVVSLDRALEIGPRPVVPSQPLPELGGRWGEGGAVPAPDGDVVRGVRAYVPGDRLRQVHWRASARYGDLVVKEADETQAPVLRLVLDMGAGGEAGESAAGRAAWYACEALRRGYAVVLTTTESGRTVTAAAPSQVMVNRRLARAEAGRPEHPDGSAARGGVLLVSDEGDRWP